MFRVCCMTGVLLREIANPVRRKRDVALSYYLAMRDDPETDWGAVNQAIRERWGQRGVDWIQRDARVRAYGAWAEFDRCKRERVAAFEEAFLRWFGWAFDALEWVRGKVTK